MNEDATLLASLLDHMPSGLLHLSADGRALRTNPRLGELLGVAPPGQDTPFSAWLDRLEASGRLQRPQGRAALRAPFHGPPGKTRWQLLGGRALELSVQPLPGGARLCLWTEATTDEALEEERARMAHMLENITDSVVLMDAEGRILQNSNNSGSLLGMPDELARAGSTHQEILRFLYRRGDFGFTQEEEVFIAERRAGILAAGRLTFAERMPDGRWAEYNFRPLLNGELLVMVRDVTEMRETLSRLEAERAEREEDRRRADLLLENTRDIVILTGGDGRILESSSRSNTLFGLPPELFAPGAHRRDILRALYRRGDFGFEMSEEQFIQDVRDQLNSLTPFQRTRQMPDGRWAEFNLVTREDGMFVVSVRDVTELQEAQLALEREQEKLRLVVDNMSDGVMLFDSEMHWRMLSRPLMKFLALPEEFYMLGTSMRDVLGWQMRRGDFGPPPEDPEEFGHALNSLIDNLRGPVARSTSARRKRAIGST
ncbi:PAS-domain containing protein [Roseococcus sp.]|uniref:PAS-domain containing protein n=1 Tax=Roseococcus sp. TaxID=2109646 RepID=UPI003BA8D0F1